MKSKIALILLCLGLLACGKSRVAELSERVENFNEALRWSSLKAASTYMSEHNKRTLVDQYSKEFQRSRIVEYSIIDVGVDKEKKTGTVLVEFSFYDTSTQDLDYRQELQTWNYDGLAKNWVVKETRFMSKSEQ